jgi:transposase
VQAPQYCGESWRRTPWSDDHDRQRQKQLEREKFELKRANEILRKASAYFAQAELDRRAK